MHSQSGLPRGIQLAEYFTGGIGNEGMQSFMNISTILKNL